MRRVVVTGMGAVTPIGNTVAEFWEGIKRNQVGIDFITYFDTEKYKAKLAAEVKNFNAKERVGAREMRRMDQFSQFAVAAAIEAYEDSKLQKEEEDSYRMGVSIGSGVGSLMGIEREHIKMLNKGPSKIHPLSAPLVLGNMAAANVAIQLGFQGKCIDVVTACATGTNSIGEAFHAIRYGELDVVAAGGVDSSISPFGVATFQSLTALTDSIDPLRASIPFDKERNGFVTGEGAGVLILEELEHAKNRDAKIYGEIIGYGATCDANHITTPLEDGSAVAKAIELAIEEAQIDRTEIDYINAHGTSTYYNDLYETRAIKRALKEHAYQVKINSTKSMIGHLFGAGGAVELIICLKEMEEGYIHPTVGLREDDPECDLDYTKTKGVFMPIHIVLSNSLGFGGHNASLIIKNYND